MSSDSTEIVTFFVISDSAGETATKLAQATMAQYPSVEFNLFRRTFVTDEKTLMQALQDALEEKALVLHTLINQELIEMTRSFCEEHQLFSFDVVLLGVSRTSKTPLSLFLANKNLKVANLPLIPQAHIPKQLWEIDPKKIVGLTNNPDILNNIRKERMRSYGLNPDTAYSDIEKIRAELDFANDLYEKLGCVVINVASLSIEETASLILNALDLEDHSYYGTETTEETD